ncbi:MAG TPA: energy transducer TonB, partial [Prolixibacteraceae bacterium]
MKLLYTFIAFKRSMKMQLENNSILELKKSNKTDQENTKGLFLHVGILVSLAFVQFGYPNNAFATSAGAQGRNISALVVDEEIIPETRQEEKKSPHSKSVDGGFSVVKDKTKINHNYEVVQLQSSQDTRVKGVQIITKGKKNTDDEIFVVVENQPEFPGGELALRKFIAKSIRYPAAAQENGIQGKVYVNFVVDKDGSVL